MPSLQKFCKGFLTTILREPGEELGAKEFGKPVSTIQPVLVAPPKFHSLKSPEGQTPNLSLLPVSPAPGAREDSALARWGALAAEGSRAAGGGQPLPPHLMVHGGGGCTPAQPARRPPPASEGQCGGRGCAGRHLLKVNEDRQPRAGGGQAQTLEPQPQNPVGGSWELQSGLRAGRTSRVPLVFPFLYVSQHPPSGVCYFTVSTPNFNFFKDLAHGLSVML